MTTTSEGPDRATLGPELASAVRWLAGRDLAPATSGNFSAVLGRDPARVLITSSGVDKRELRDDQLLVVDDAGQPVAGETLRPSAETLLHTRLVVRDPRIGCVLHTHSIWNTLVSRHFAATGRVEIEGFELQKGIAGVATHDATLTLPIVANHQDMEVLAGWMDTALDAAAAPTPGFLIAGHGLYTWGRTVAECRRHAETLEFLLECVGRRTDLTRPTA